MDTPNSNDQILICETVHKRYFPKKHRFRYTLPYVLTEITNHSHRWGIFSINSSEYLHTGSGSFLEKLTHYDVPDLHSNDTRIFLVTLPKLGIKTFNPISLYFWTDSTRRIKYTLIEVTNTYHEKHLYGFETPPQTKKWIRSKCPKKFHVSPFMEDTGDYQFTLSPSLDHFELYIEVIQNQKTILYAHLIEHSRYPLNAIQLLKTNLHYPLGIIGTFPRILKEAITLHFFKKLPGRSRPIPTDTNTIRKLPLSWTDTFIKKQIIRILGTFTHGYLTLTFPDHSTMQFGNPNDPLKADLTIHSPYFLRRIIKRGEIGLGEGFVEAEWSTENLETLLTYFLKNKTVVRKREKGSIGSHIAFKIGHFLRKNTPQKSTSNIQEHYDLSNAFYQLFLDPEMLYSSAIFTPHTPTLESAQIEKIRHLCESLKLKKHHHVLEIGSGWGATALFIAKTFGCKVTTLTLSQAQYDYAKDRIQAEGLDHLISIKMEDYRHHQGQYDRIISIEMIEAVGHEFLKTYFEKINDLLVPSGLVGIQGIFVPDQRYDRYRSRVDWIQKYIFPGGHLPSLYEIHRILKQHTRLGIEKAENFSPHYAKTLSIWHENLTRHQDEIMKTQKFDAAFIRKWRYYFVYCQVGFSQRYIHVMQLILSGSQNEDLISEDLQTSHLHIKPYPEIIKTQ
jgi:cyclopropane-fatty-acyl-phospholipid synthase